MNLQVKIDRIKNNLDAQSYTVAAGEAVKIIEIAFRKLLIDGLALLSDKDRLKVMQAIIDIGKGEKGVESFGLGQMLAVLRKSKFNDAWETATSSDLSAIKMINLDALNEIRIKITHEAAEASKFEAEFLFHALEGVIQAFGIMSLEKETPIAHKTSSSTKAESQEVVEVVKGLVSKVSGKRRASTYAPTDPNEAKRLTIQGRYSLDVDMYAFKHALRIVPKDRELIGLDLGCARGGITKTRFGAFSVFQKVFGIDINEEAVRIAQETEGNETFEFHSIDIEGKEAQAALNSLLEQAGATGFDVIFSALTLLHLSDPIKVLRRLRKLLNKGGVIILCGADDGTLIGYPDEEGLVSDIVRETLLFPNVSDRLNARKQYYQLWKSGFRDIKVFNQTVDTAGMDLEERVDLFTADFSHRKTFLLKRVEQFPNDLQWRERLEWMEEKLDQLEQEFESEYFYYMKLISAAVGQKK